MRTQTVDIYDGAQHIRETILADVIDAQDELVAKLDDEYDSFHDVPAEDRAAYDRLEQERVEQEGIAGALERAAEQWGGGEFTVRELTTGQVATIQDEVAGASFDMDETGLSGTPKQGYGQIVTLQQAIVSQPAQAPTRTVGGHDEPDPAEYPAQVGDWLFEKVNNLNTVGETDLGNSSLRERMTSAD